MKRLLLLLIVALGQSLVHGAARPPPRGVGSRTRKPAATQRPAKGVFSFSFGQPPPPPPPPPKFGFFFGQEEKIQKAKQEQKLSPSAQLSEAFESSKEAALDFVDTVSSLEKSKAAALNIVDTVRSEFRPLQVVSGFAVATVLFTGTVVGIGNTIGSYIEEDGTGPVLERTFEFGTILEGVMSGYVDRNVDLDKLFETAVNSMLSTLDPYSTYENVDESANLNMRTTGRYGGVGLTIGKDADGRVLVLNALEGFAYDAGVRPGDRIFAIDGQPVAPLSVDQVKDKLRGEPGTTLAITVERDGAIEKTLTMPLPRKLVRLPDVTLAAVDAGGVGYIKLEGFSEGTAEEMGRAITRLQAERELPALVLDMRDNPGGLLDAAVAVSQQLVPEGTEIVSTAGRVYGEGASLSYRSTKPPLLSPRTRLVVLVNGNTASAAEIVTGVVQDTDRGVVVGERTYGKGLVQVVSPMPGGGALKLTVAKYYTPSGRCIQAVDYAGGRLEAKGPKPTKVGEAAGGDAAAGELDAPATPPAGGGSVAPEQQQQPAGAKKEEAPERKKNAAGAVLRIDPSEPSMPSASVADANTQFVTKHGRAVTAGGGIAPDVPIEGRTLGELERNLLQRGLFFDFSSEYLRKHPAAPEELARSVERGQDEAYREFVAYVRGRLSGTAGGDKSKALTLETAGLQRIDDLTKSLKGDSHTKSRSELAALRKTLLEEQLEEFRTEKTALQQDLTESLLGRLTPPSVRLAAQLETDPQVAEARRIAADVQRYEKMLEPDPKPLSVIEVVATKSASDRAAAEALVFPL